MNSSRASTHASRHAPPVIITLARVDYTRLDFTAYVSWLQQLRSPRCAR
jgi:hypothetical protein